MERRQQDLDNALRLQKLEISMEQVLKELQENTESTKDLLKAWNTSKTNLSFVKASVVLGAGVVAIWTGVTKLWGH